MILVVIGHIVSCIRRSGLSASGRIPVNRAGGVPGWFQVQAETIEESEWEIER